MSRDNASVWPQDCNILTVTPACFQDCFGRGVFKDIDFSFLARERIEAKHKVDQLAKGLVVHQACCFCFQFMTRIWQLLPISLLELNTFAHSLCSLFLYTLWWYKLGDINDPFVIHTEASETLRDLCAAQWTSGAVGKYCARHEVCDGSSTQQLSSWTPRFVHGGSELFMNTFRGHRGTTLGLGNGEHWYIFDLVER